MDVPPKFPFFTLLFMHGKDACTLMPEVSMNVQHNLTYFSEISLTVIQSK